MYQSATLIDNVLVSQKLYSEHKCHLITEDISDYLPCMVSLPVLTSHKKEPFLIKKRKLNDKIVKKIVQDLSSIKWQQNYSDANTAFNMLHNIVLESLDKNAQNKHSERTLDHKGDPNQSKKAT